jgi:ABC-type lipoprotein release transport system permease subunit
LCFILLIALFNVIGSLSMLILEKKQDAGILKRLGADHKTIRKVFLYEGVMIAFLGAFSGILLGVLLCLIQQHFGLLKLGSGNFIVGSYPVLVKASDLFFILLTVLAVSLPSVWWPVHYYFKNDELP